MGHVNGSTLQRIHIKSSRLSRRSAELARVEKSILVYFHQAVAPDVPASVSIYYPKTLPIHV